EAASDLEHELPCMITDLRSFEITSARGERLTARARGRLGQHARFDVVLRPGWCVMQSRFIIGGMAAGPEGQALRVAFLRPLRLPRRPPPARHPAARPAAPPRHPAARPAPDQPAGTPAPGPLTRRRAAAHARLRAPCGQPAVMPLSAPP